MKANRKPVQIRPALLRITPADKLILLRHRWTYLPVPSGIGVGTFPCVFNIYQRGENLMYEITVKNVETREIEVREEASEFVLATQRGLDSVTLAVHAGRLFMSVIIMELFSRFVPQYRPSECTRGGRDCLSE